MRANVHEATLLVNSDLEMLQAHCSNLLTSWAQIDGNDMDAPANFVWRLLSSRGRSQEVHFRRRPRTYSFSPSKLQITELQLVIRVSYRAFGTYATATNPDNYPEQVSTPSVRAGRHQHRL